MTSSPAQSQYSARNRRADAHFSNALTPGSQTFEVHGRRFVIPIAIIERNGIDFGDAMDQGEDPSGPSTTLKLDDVEADAFEDFVNYLYDPIHSPLYGPNPRLKNTVHILQIAHKYRAHEIEKRASSIAKELSQPAVLSSHLGLHFSCIDLFRVATTVQETSIAENAWQIVLQNFRTGSLDARSILDEGTDSGQPKFLGSAYYEVMLGGPQKWLNDPTLSINEQSRLTQGFKRCIQEWDTFELSVTIGNFNSRDETRASSKQEEFSVVHDRADFPPDSPIQPDSPRTLSPMTPEPHPWGRVLPGAPTLPRSPPGASPDASVPARPIIGAVVERIAMAHSRLGLHSWDVLGRLRAVSQWVPDRPGDRSVVKVMNNLVQCAQGTLRAVEVELPNYFKE